MGFILDMLHLAGFFVAELLLYAKLSNAALSEASADGVPMLKLATVTGCTDQVFTESIGTIISPNYPNGYPDHISCTYHIRANVGEVITIIFDDIDIEESGDFCDQPRCCVFNWVKLGPSLNGSEKQYCGKGTEFPPYVSSTSKMWIKFHVSHIRHGGRGFKLRYAVGPRRTSGCLTNQFRCLDGLCVLLLSRCNGFPECNDGSDERLCPAECPSGRRCQSSSKCYEDNEHCNGIVDCADYSDELGCGVCPSNKIHCHSLASQCYDPVLQRCNKIMDCADGSDEKNCLNSCPGKIMCTSGIGCYTPSERCDGIPNCSDSSDETKCLADLCNYERGGFLCGNGRCIREMWKCDRSDDCGDGSDESNCLRNSVLTAAVMGSLICGLLLVIAVSCTCRLYSLRAYESQMSNRETMLSRLSQEFLFREPPPSYAVAVGQHCRNLCVENIHYNPCARRGRRRPRRARRVHESRRPSIAIVDNVTQNESRPPFSFTGALQSAVNGYPSPLTLQSHCNNSNSVSGEVVQVRSDGDIGHQSLGDIPGVPQAPKRVDDEDDELLKEHDGDVCPDAESSFNESSKDSTNSTKDDSSDNLNVNYSLGAVLAFQNEISADVEEDGSMSNVEISCDIDLHPLIT